MRQPATTRRAGDGFTLVELMVVIAIIAIISATVATGISMARAKAHETTCISQLLQIGKAFQMYVDDYQGRPPFLHQLWPAYVSDKRIFVCPLDRWTDIGGWDGYQHRIANRHLEIWPIPVSYAYLPGTWHRDWEEARSAPGRPGYVVCFLHGTPDKTEVRVGLPAPIHSGRILRLCFDGGVVVRDIGPRLKMWKAWTDQEKQKDEP